MNFQVLDLKGKQFLNSLNDDLIDIKLLYTKEGPQIKYFGHSNSLYTRAIKAITNHTPIGEYQLRFFLRKEFSCPCRLYLSQMSYSLVVMLELNDVSEI